MAQKFQCYLLGSVGGLWVRDIAEIKRVIFVLNAPIIIWLYLLYRNSFNLSSLFFLTSSTEYFHFRMMEFSFFFCCCSIDISARGKLIVLFHFHYISPHQRSDFSRDFCPPFFFSFWVFLSHSLSLSPPPRVFIVNSIIDR